MPSARALDASALGLTALCMVHCLALPFLVVFSPALALSADVHWLHPVLVALAVPITGVAVLRRPAAPPTLLALAALGLALLATGAAAHDVPSLETGLTVAGGLVLAVVHVWNWRRTAG